MSTCSNWERLVKTVRFFVCYWTYALWRDIWRYWTAKRKDIRGQTVLITGAATGIGRCLAQQLALNHGATVLILDVNQSEGEKAASNITDAGGMAYFFKCDVTNEFEMKSVASNLTAQYGLTPSIVVCNAGILKMGLFTEMKVDEFRRCLDVNVVGVFNTVQTFLPAMIERKEGHLVCIASICSFHGSVYGQAYCSSKFAVRGLMECLHDELYERKLNDIKTTTVFPYFVATPLVTDNGSEPHSTFNEMMTIDDFTERLIDAVLRERKEMGIPPLSMAMLCIYLKALNTRTAWELGKRWLDIRYSPKSIL